MPYEFSQTVAACATLGAVREAFGREIARHGFDHSAYRLVVPTETGTRSEFLFRNWSGEWTRRFERKRIGTQNNFVITEARRRTTPFTWRDIRAARAFSPGDESVWNEAQAFGWRDGFVLPVHGPRGYLATIGMATRERELDMSASRRLHLQMVALVVHLRCQELSNAIVLEEPSEALSARELECLRWVAAGKTDWEIAAILSISQATVKFHLDRARRRLKAATRAQAVAQLILRGLY